MANATKYTYAARLALCYPKLTTLKHLAGTLKSQMLPDTRISEVQSPLSRLCVA